MCVVIAKYFSGTGWVGVKNRDRNYVPDLSFHKKQNKNTEILMFHDDITNIPILPKNSKISRIL